MYKVSILINDEDGVNVYEAEIGPLDDEELFVRDQVNSVKVARVINEAYGVPFDELY